MIRIASYKYEQDMIWISILGTWIGCEHSKREAWFQVDLQTLPLKHP